MPWLLACLMSGAASAQAFKNPGQIPLSGASAQCCVTDFNGDGRPDIVAAGGSTVSIYTNQGDGQFKQTATATLPGTAGNWPEPAVGDVNGDGKLDIVAVEDAAAGSAVVVATMLGNGDGTFSAPIVSTLGLSGVPSNAVVNTVYLADVNNDGHLDVIFGEPAVGNPYIALGKGDGTFLLNPTPISTYAPYKFWMADFNGDGRIDYLDGSGLFIGNGDGTFKRPTQIPSSGSNYYTNLIVTDFNKDGFPDIVYISSNSTISVLINDGHGAFSISTGPCSGCNGLENIADVNGDGIPDLITDDSGLSVRLGQGGVQFGPAIHTSAPRDSYSLGGSYMLADLNGDGKPDLVVPNQTRLLLFFGSGDGTFVSCDLYDTTEQAQGVSVGDFNNDGHPDFAVATLSSYPRVFLGDGKGRFTATADQNGNVSSMVSYYTMAAADFNGDGNLDLVQSGSNTNAILLGRGDGSFYAPTANTNATLFVGDFNGDGRADMASLNLGTTNDSIVLSEGQKDGSFATVSTAPGGITGYPALIGAFDLNSDGRKDLFFLNPSSNAVYCALSNGDGTFNVVQSAATAFYSNPMAVAGDLDGDGNADVLVASWTGVMIYYGRGGGKFDPGVALNTGYNSTVPYQSGSAFRIADMDSDGRPDLVFLRNGLVEVLHNLGNRVFGNAVDYNAGYSPNQLEIADVNGDGLPDIIAADSTNGVSVLLNLGNTTATKGTITISPEPSLYNQPFTASVTVSGVSNTAVPTGTVSFTFNGNIIGSAALVNGSASVSYTPGILTAPGSYTVGVQYGGDASYSAAGYSTVHTISAVMVPVSVSVKASAATALRSQTVRFLATVSAPDSTITPMVQFTDNGQNLGVSTIIGGVAQIDTNMLTVGIHSIVARYLGLTTNIPATIYPATNSAPAMVTISTISTTTTLTTSLANAVAGTPVTLTATVAGGGANPYGSVTFYDGTSVLGTSLANGTAIWTTAFTTAGTHTLSAVFHDTETFAGSSSVNVAFKSSIIVGGGAGSVALRAGETLIASEPLTLTASLDSVQEVGALAGHEVFFFDHGALLGSAVSSADGEATLIGVPRVVGSHAYHATLVGDEVLQAFDSPQLASITIANPLFALQLSNTRLSLEGSLPETAIVNVQRALNFTSPLSWTCDSSTPAVLCTVAETGNSVTVQAGRSGVAAIPRGGNDLIRIAGFGLATFTLAWGRRARVIGSSLCRGALTMTVGASLLGCSTIPKQTIAVITVSARIDGLNPQMQSQQILVRLRQ